MPNRDRVSEVYKDADSPAHERTRRRIDWMCEQATGQVLDLGCSQGIATILMARSGFTAIGVDIELDRLEYAHDDRRRESPDVARRVAFVGGSGLSLPFPDDTFDTVVLGEVLEHLPEPAPVLTEAARVTRPDGRAVITVPFGYHPHHDHRHTFYVASFLDLLGSSFSPVSIDIVDNYLHVVARPGAMVDDDRRRWVVELQRVAEEAILATESDLFEGRRSAIERARTLRSSLDRYRKRAEEVTRQRDEWQRRAKQRGERAREYEARLARIEQTRWWRLRTALGRARRRAARTRSHTVRRAARRAGSRRPMTASELFLGYVACHREYWPERRFVQSEKLEKRLQRWSAMWDVNADAATQKLFEMARERRAHRPAPVYITGLGGSGSHWLAGMLSELPQHVSVGEVYFAPKLLEEMAALGDDDQGLVADAIHLLHSPPDPGVIDRSLVNCAAGPYKIPHYKRWDPGATVILLARDPRDQVLSTAFRKPIHREKVAPDADDLEYLLQQCATSRRAIERYQGLPHGADIEITYEQLRDDAAVALRAVTEALGHRIDDEGLRHIVEEYDADRVRAGLAEAKGNLDQGGQARGWRVDADADLRALVHAEVVEAIEGWDYPLCNCTGVDVATSGNSDRVVELSARDTGTLHLRGPGDDVTVWQACEPNTHHPVPSGHAVLLRIGAEHAGTPADLQTVEPHALDALCLAANPRVDDGWAPALRRLEGLVELDLARTRISDATLETLSDHPGLQAVNLWDTAVSDESVEAFRRARPACRVVHHPPDDLRG